MKHKHSNKVDGRPALQWYPADPLNDVGLKLCSLSAQGLWYNMLWNMFYSPERGVLLEPNKKKIDAVSLAAMVSKPLAEVEQGLSELEAREVYETRDDGAIYNRRMVRDEKQRLNKVLAGRRGGLQKAALAKEGSSSSSSSSPSSSSSKKNKNTVKGWGEIWDTWMEAEIQDAAIVASAKDVQAMKNIVSDYSVEDVVKAIKKYAEILNGEKYLLKTHWTLAKFLEEHMTKFFPGSKPEETYRRGDILKSEEDPDAPWNKVLKPGECVVWNDRKNSDMPTNGEGIGYST